MLSLQDRGADHDEQATARAANVTAVLTQTMPIVGPSRVGRAMLVLVLFLAVSVVAVLYDQHEWDFLGGTALGGAPAGIVQAGVSLAPLVVVSVALMVLVVEGGTMVADAFREQLRERRERSRVRAREEGRQEGRDEGLEEGRHEGLELGHERERAKWQDWLTRKQAAELDNRAFDEPPPSAE